MTEKAVSFVLDNLLPLLEEELKLLSGVSGEVRYIGDELERMRAFLRVADAIEEIEEKVKICIKQVRDVVYDTEDVLEEFMIHLAAQDDEEGCLGFLCKMAHYIKKLQTRHQIASSIKDIKKRVQDISEGSQRYPFNSLEQGSTSTSSITAKSSTWHDPRGDALLIEETELVGFDKPRKKLIGWLLDGATSERGTISVVGMGGLGKTTLVKKVYDDQQVKKYFESHAWITVSQSFNIIELLKDMIQQLFGESKQPVPQGLDTKNEVGLKEMLKEFLQQKRYLVVYDDIWSIDAWAALKYALPNNNCGSRVIVTTRFLDIASSCRASYDVGYIYKLKPLPLKESRTLFCKKAFGENTCPPRLEHLAWSILAKCEGLPLAIVAIGGLLATKDSTRRDEWEIVNRSLATELEKNDKLKSMKKILSLSYNDLPYHLKPCFLYLSIFPEDHMIKSMRLIRLWVAEGFIEEQEGRTLEEVGKGYLNELINRSLIQIAETTIDGRIRRCRVHDLVRDIILSKSKDQNFGTIKDERNNTSLHERIRRLSVHKNCEHITPSTKNLSQLRSLIMLKVNTLSNQKLFAAFRLLKVLDLRGLPLETFPNEFINLFHLRYLCLRRTKIKTIPNSIEKLQNLETLDLKHAYVSELPMGIMKLQKLRHLLVYHYIRETFLTFEGVQGSKIGREIGRLTSLQKLCFIEANNQCDSGDIIRELGSLNQLRRLGIQKLREEDGKDLCYSIEKMTNLHSLSIMSIEEKEALDLQSLSSPPPLLQRLYVRGRLEKLPHWIPLLDNLAKIRLRWSYLRDDPLEALQALPNLVELELLQAYDGESLCFKRIGFQRLKLLRLDRLDGLKCVGMEKGAMPDLQNLSISRCGLLEKLPIGIELLVNLKLLHFSDMPFKLVKTLLPDEGGEDHSKVTHIPKVFFSFWGERGWEHYRL